MDAVLFNPSSAQFDNYDLPLDEYRGEMVSYIMGGEILSESIAKKYELFGNKKIVGYDPLWEDIYDIAELFRKNFKISNIKENTEKAWEDILKEFKTSFNLHSLQAFFDY